MPERDTAGAQLARILHLLPEAARPQGAGVREMAETLGITPGQLLRDVTEVTERAFYHPAGSAAETQILVEPDRVTLLSRGEFHRPPRLTPREAAALGVALRALALDSGGAGEGERLREVAGRLEAALAWTDEAPEVPVLIAPGGADPTGVRTALRDATRERRSCRLRYLKPGAAEPAWRAVSPYALVHAERWWYLLAADREDGAIRRFRTDRILEVERGEESFEIPADFDAAAHLDGGRAFVADALQEVRVRYGPRVAPWITEREPGVERNEDGSVVCSHAVADPGWLVRHVLQYGPDAEVLGPPELRERVAAAAERMAAQ